MRKAVRKWAPETENCGPIIQKKCAKSPEVRIVLYAGGDNRKSAEQMLYASIAGVVFAEQLSMAGYQVTISILFGSKHPKRAEFCGHLVDVKQANQPIDRSLLAYLTSDARFFRYEGFQGVLTAWDYFRKTAPKGLGHMLDNEGAKDLIESQFQDETVFYFGQAYAWSKAMGALKEAVESINTK